MKKILSFFCVIACVMGFTACSDKADDEKISVYTSFYAMYDFAREIGGDHINLYNVCPTGTEPHDFEPTAQDMAKISDGDVFIYNGLGMESWTNSSFFKILEGSDVITVNTSDNIGLTADLHEETEHDDTHHHADIHIWLNPSNAYIQMEAIANAFIKADPNNSEYYTKRLDECKIKIDTLISDYETAVSEFASKNIITSHEAYSNLCNKFNLTQIALNGTDNSQEPTPARLVEITEYIKTNNIKYIFSEPLGTGAVAETVAKDTGCEILVLDPFEGSTENKDYFTVMYKNLEALKTALK